MNSNFQEKSLKNITFESKINNARVIRKLADGVTSHSELF